jgi:hypothetical protein
MILPPASGFPHYLPRERQIYRAPDGDVTVCVDRNVMVVTEPGAVATGS